MSEYYATRYNFDSGRTKVWRAITEFLQVFVNRESDRVLDVGSGYCDFINNIKAKSKLAIDLNIESSKYCNPDVEFIKTKTENLSMIPTASLDVIFSSNVFEHLDDSEISKTLEEFCRVLKADGKVILMQPNYRYAYREYYDDYTHKKVFSHLSLKDCVEAHGFKAIAVIPRFLPFSLKSKLPKSYFLTKIYLALPYRPLAKQMLLAFQKEPSN